MQDLRGKVVLVKFWATSCVTCVKQMPDNIANYNQYHPQGYETIAVAMNYDPPNYVLNFAQTRKLPFPVALDTSGELPRRSATSASRPRPSSSTSKARSSSATWASTTRPNSRPRCKRRWQGKRRGRILVPVPRDRHSGQLRGCRSPCRDRHPEFRGCQSPGGDRHPKDQKAGTTAPLYFSMMNLRTASECRALTSFFTAGASLLSGRAATRLA